MMGLLRGLCIPVGVLVAWELASRHGVIPVNTFSKPSDIVLSGLHALLFGDLIAGTEQTLFAAMVGVLIALTIGVPLGLAIGISRTARGMISPTLDAFRSIPPVALIPLSLLIFGFGLWMEATVIAFASVWSLIIATSAAVREIEPRLAEVARALELDTVAYVRKLVLPAAVGRIAVGLRLSIGVALVVAVTVEIVVNPRGLGYLLITAQQSLRPDLMYAILFWVGVVGWFINSMLIAFDRTFLRHFGVQRGDF